MYEWVLARMAHISCLLVRCPWSQFAGLFHGSASFYFGVDGSMAYADMGN